MIWKVSKRGYWDVCSIEVSELKVKNLWSARQEFVSYCNNNLLSLKLLVPVCHFGVERTLERQTNALNHDSCFIVRYVLSMLTAVQLYPREGQRETKNKGMEGRETGCKKGTLPTLFLTPVCVRHHALLLLHLSLVPLFR